MADDPVAAFLASHHAAGSASTAVAPHATADPVSAFLQAHKGAQAAAAPAPAPEPAHASSDPVAAFLGTHKAATSENPFLSAVKQVGSGIGNALDAQRWGVAKLATGESDPDKQRTAERNAVGTQGVYDALGHVPVVGHALQGASDVVQDTITDPLTYETLGAAPLMRTLGLAGKLAPAAMKAINATPYGRKLYDFTHWGGEVAREQGPEVVDTIRGAANKASSTGARVQQHLANRFDAVTKGLKDEEKVSVGQALNGEILPEELDPHLRPVVRQLRTLTDMDYKMRTNTARNVLVNQATKDMPAADKATLVQALRAGKTPTGPLGTAYTSIQRQLAEQMPKRTDYLPTVHGAPAAESTAAKTINTAEHFDPRSMQRDQVKVTEPAQLDTGFNAMAKNAGRQASVGVIHDALGSLLDDPKVAKLFETTLKATGDKATDLDKIKEHWKALVGYPRAATVSLTPRHGANILDLLANTVGPAQAPQVLKDTMALAAKLTTASPKEYAQLTKEGRDLGAISGNFAERKPFFQNVPVLKNWTQLNNKLVWAIDEAAKQTYAKSIVSSGEAKGLEAGGKAAKRLVDYEHRAPSVEALRYVAPFGTFRGSIPGAVLGGVARNPARAAFLNRASGGTMFGGKPGKNQHGLEMYNPTADVGRGLDAPQDFLRGTIAAPVQAAGTLAAEAFTGSPGASIQTTAQEIMDAPGQIIHGKFGQLMTPRKVSPYAKAVALRAARYLNYGHPIDARWIAGAALAGIPEARDVSEQLGLGQFAQSKGTIPERIGSAVLQQAAGVTSR